MIGGEGEDGKEGDEDFLLFCRLGENGDNFLGGSELCSGNPGDGFEDGDEKQFWRSGRLSSFGCCELVLTFRTLPA